LTKTQKKVRKKKRDTKMKREKQAGRQRNKIKVTIKPSHTDIHRKSSREGAYK